MSARTRASTASPPLAITGGHRRRAVSAHGEVPAGGPGWKGPDHAHGALEPPGQPALRVPLRGGTSVPSIASLEPGTGPAHDYKEVMVEVGRVDDLDVAVLGLVKIDVEGHELEVVEGARDRLQRDQPPLIVEIEEVGARALGPCPRPSYRTSATRRSFSRPAASRSWAAAGSRTCRARSWPVAVPTSTISCSFTSWMAGRAADCASAATSSACSGELLCERREA